MLLFYSNYSLVAHEVQGLRRWCRSAMLLPQHTVLLEQFHTNAALRGQAAAKHAASQNLASRRSVIPNPVAFLPSLHSTSRGPNLPLGRIWNLPQRSPFPTSAQHVFTSASQASSVQALRSAPTGTLPPALGFPTSSLPLVFSQSLQELGLQQHSNTQRFTSLFLSRMQRHKKPNFVVRRTGLF